MSPGARERMLDGLRRHSPEAVASISRHSLTVVTLKKILPVAAVILLVALAVAPSLRFGPDSNRVTYHIQKTASSNTASRMQDAKYHGIDEHGQPFTLTANAATDQGSDNVTLEQPEGDITLNSGAWLVLKSDAGLFHQKSQTLGLNGNVTLYRNDGTTLNVAKADIDLRQSSASSAAPVTVQGPFGTLNALNGFSITGHGTDILFKGPVTLVLAQADVPALTQ
jgi:lipopolysaccharide export system protein LptC